MSKLRSAIFLDRDGVINQNRADYVKSWSEYNFLPGVFSALNHLARSNYLIIVISNQSPISRGLMRKKRVEDINARMQFEIEQQGGRVDAIYYCPHKPSDKCNCRKPAPGMLLQAADELEIDLASSYFVGDAVSDIEAAFAAGCQPVYVLTGLGQEQLPVLRKRGYDGKVSIVRDLAEAVHLITCC